jgi:hypothetical protein
MKVEAEPSKRFHLYHANDEPYECIGQYETVGEVWAQKRRVDWRYIVKVGAESFTLAEFSRWVKQHFWECHVCGQMLEIQNRRSTKLTDGYVENCKLRDHIIGDECIARRQPELATELMRRRSGKE